jgi:hypothetical protein
MNALSSNFTNTEMNLNTRSEEFFAAVVGKLIGSVNICESASVVKPVNSSRVKAFGVCDGEFTGAHISKFFTDEGFTGNAVPVMQMTSNGELLQHQEG